MTAAAAWPSGEAVADGDPAAASRAAAAAAPWPASSPEGESGCSQLSIKLSRLRSPTGSSVSARPLPLLWLVFKVLTKSTSDVLMSRKSSSCKEKRERKRDN